MGRSGRRTEAAKRAGGLSGLVRGGRGGRRREEHRGRGGHPRGRAELVVAGAAQQGGFFGRRGRGSGGDDRGSGGRGRSVGRAALRQLVDEALADGREAGLDAGDLAELQLGENDVDRLGVPLPGLVDLAALQLVVQLVHQPAVVLPHGVDGFRLGDARVRGECRGWAEEHGLDLTVLLLRFFLFTEPRNGPMDGREEVNDSQRETRGAIGRFSSSLIFFQQ